MTVVADFSMMTCNKFPPFSKTSKGYMQMAELFDEGTLSSNMPPKVVYQKDNVFLKYKPEAFRAGLNKYKTERGFHIRGVMSTTATEEPVGNLYGAHVILLILFIQCSLTICNLLSLEEKADGDKKKTKGEMHDGDVGSFKVGLEKLRAIGRQSMENGLLKATSDLGVEMNSSTISNWMPIHFKATFENAILRDQIGVVVCTAKVEGDGGAVSIKTRVPTLVTDSNVFLLFLRIPKCQEQMKPGHNFCVRAFPKSMAKQRAVLVALIWMDFVVALEFPVAEDIPIVAFLTIGGTYYLYLELMAKERTSYMDNNGQLSGDVVDLSKAAAMFWKSI